MRIMALIFSAIALRPTCCGASFDEIGQLLRHQSADSTRIYAKLDIETLRTLSQPWPGGAQ